LDDGCDDDDQQLHDVWTPLGLGETDVRVWGLFLKVRTPLVSRKLGAALMESKLREGEPLL